MHASCTSRFRCASSFYGDCTLNPHPHLYINFFQRSPVQRYNLFGPNFLIFSHELFFRALEWFKNWKTVNFWQFFLQKSAKVWLHIARPKKCCMHKHRTDVSECFLHAHTCATAHRMCACTHAPFQPTLCILLQIICHSRVFSCHYLLQIWQNLF